MRREPTRSCRTLLLWAWAVSLPALASDEVSVPAQVQARLLVRAAGHDRNLGVRAGKDVSVFILSKPGNVLSDQTARQLFQALQPERLVGGLPHRETLVPFESVQALAERVAQERPGIVYLSSGFSRQEIAQVAQALAGKDVLTVAAAAGDVQPGLVLGFDLLSGRPRIQVNLKQARRQNVDFDADFLGLTQVVE